MQTVVSGQNSHLPDESRLSTLWEKHRPAAFLARCTNGKGRHRKTQGRTHKRSQETRSAALMHVWVRLVVYRVCICMATMLTEVLDLLLTKLHFVQAKTNLWFLILTWFNQRPLENMNPSLRHFSFTHYLQTLLQIKTDSEKWHNYAKWKKMQITSFQLDSVQFYLQSANSPQQTPQGKVHTLQYWRENPNNLHNWTWGGAAICCDWVVGEQEGKENLRRWGKTYTTGESRQTLLRCSKGI